MKDTLINTDKLTDMMGCDQSSMNEFWEAAILSFKEYKIDFAKYMRKKDLDNLRKAGHKIKPAASMLGLPVIINQYERAKQLLKTEATQKDIQASINNVQVVCDRVINEFNQRIIK